MPALLRTPLLWVLKTSVVFSVKGWKDVGMSLKVAKGCLATFELVLRRPGKVRTLGLSMDLLPSIVGMLRYSHVRALSW